VDNLPIALVPKFAELCSQSDRGITRAALGIDIREKDLVGSFGSLYDQMKEAGYDLQVLFLEAGDETLVRRFSETRRPHPLAKDKPLAEAIRLERAMMDGIKKRADGIIDTSLLTVHQLRDELHRRFGTGAAGSPLTISVMSFGFKYGVPYDADTVFDVRFLPNPNFVPALKPLTGRDKDVLEFVRKKEGTAQFLRKVMGLLDYLIPLYAKEGKTYLTIAVGCTGGRHRSVAVAELLKKRLSGRGLDIIIRHRDADR
jgi:UPF0042 nucleotide-binding protein